MSDASPAATVTIAPAAIDDPDVAALLAALDAYLDGLYPAEDNFLTVAADDFTGTNGVFLAARLDGVAVGCGGATLAGWRRDTAEVKRMYVAPPARGHGIGIALLAALEAWAAAAGIGRLVLETGARNTEAMGLYRRAGFAPDPVLRPVRDGRRTACASARSSPVAPRAGRHRRRAIMRR